MENSNKTSFVKQGAILAIAGLISRFLGFIYRPFLLKMIGEEGAGFYGQAYTVYFFFLIISSAGLPVAISKMVSERVEQKQFRAAHQVFKVSLVVAGVSGLVSAMVLWLGAGIISNFIKSPGLYLSLITLSPTVFIVAIMSVFRGYFQGYKNTVPTAISQLIEQVVNVVATLVLAFLFMNSLSISEPIEKGFIYGSAGATAGTGVGAFVGLLAIYGIYLLAKPRFNKNMKKDKTKLSSISNKEIVITLLRLSVPIIMGSAIFSISNLIDAGMVNSRLMVNGNFTYLEAQALYGRLSNRFVAITTLPISISTSLAIAAIPSISASNSVGNYKDVNEKINAALKISMLLAIPSAVGIGVLGEPILKMVFGSGVGKEFLYIGFISIIFLSLAQILTGMLQGIDKVRIPVIGALLGCLVKIPLNYFLVANKFININGAVISTIACYLVASIVDWYFLFKYTKVKPDITSIFVKPVFASVIMGLATYVSYYICYYIISSNIISTLLAVLVGVISYFLIMIIIKGFSPSDLEKLPMGNKIAKIIF